MAAVVADIGGLLVGWLSARGYAQAWRLFQLGGGACGYAAGTGGVTGHSTRDSIMARRGQESSHDLGFISKISEKRRSKLLRPLSRVDSKEVEEF
jgi:hypothetical protein